MMDHPSWKSAEEAESGRWKLRNGKDIEKDTR